MTSKGRLSATVDADLLAAGHAAVATGRAENVSAWVNDALWRQVEHDRRMAAFAGFLEAYEAKHGVITEEEMADAARQARGRAVVVRGSRRRASA
jgi:hypothetical protein